MAKLDEQRVNVIYEKLTNKAAGPPGTWNIERRNFAQKIVYIEEACKSVIAAIARLEGAGPDDDIRALERDLRTEFRFLDTLRE